MTSRRRASVGATLTKPDIESVEECLKRHERLVYHVIKKLFGPQHVIDEDLVQIGRIALWKAAQSFEPEKGGKFSTHAGKAIWNEFTNAKRKARYQKRTLDEGTEVIHLDQICKWRRSS